MLLLVVQAQFDQRGRCLPGSFIGGLDEGLHCDVDMVPVVLHLGQPGPREQAALWPRMARAQRLVVRIEEQEEPGVKRPVTRRIRLQHDGFEEPGGVRQVPLGGAGVGHGLDALVFSRQRRRQRLGLGPDRGVKPCQALAPGIGCPACRDGRQHGGHERPFFVLWQHPHLPVRGRSASVVQPAHSLQHRSPEFAGHGRGRAGAC